MGEVQNHATLGVLFGFVVMTVFETLFHEVGKRDCARIAIPHSKSSPMGVWLRKGPCRRTIEENTKMEHALRKGISFGLTSAVITTLGLMVGLNSGTHSKIAVLAGILTIAIADAFSDALGIHVSEEAENTHTDRHIWGATIATFLAKFLFAMTFVVPVVLLSLSTAIVVSLIWGMTILTVLSYVIARSQDVPPWKIIGEHLVIAVVVIAVTHWVGDRIGTLGV